MTQFLYINVFMKKITIEFIYTVFRQKVAVVLFFAASIISNQELSKFLYLYDFADLLLDIPYDNGRDYRFIILPMRIIYYSIFKNQFHFQQSIYFKIFEQEKRNTV